MLAQRSKVHQGCGPAPAVSQLAQLGGKLKREPVVDIRRTLAVAAAGAMLSVSAWFVAAHWETKVAELEFGSRASNVAFTLQTGLNEYLSKIVALRALFEAADHRVTRAEFQIFADRILQDQPAILSMSWIPRVSREERFAHEQAAAQDGISNYRIRSVGSDGKLTVSTEQYEYFPVYYTTKRDHPHAIYGLDLGDDGMREETLQRARDSNQLTASTSLVLQTGSGDRRGFFVVLPLYKSGAPLDSLEARRANLTGFVQGVFKIDLMVDSILAGIKSPIDFAIYPSTSDSRTHPLLARKASSLGRPEFSGPAGTGPHWSGDVSVADLRWRLAAVPSASGGAFIHLSAWILLIAGLMVTGVGVAFVHSSARQSIRLLRANKQTSELALTDVLTTLPNRRAFMERLETVCLLKQPASIAIIYIDLDHFKDVNDTLGHSTGDNLLRQVSQRLPQYIGGADMVARFGGDEFAVLLVGPCDQTQVGALAANIVGAIAGRYHVGGNDIHITASVGCTCSTREVSGPEALMMQADLALYRAKEDGRNCFRFHDLILEQKFRERVAISDALQTGIQQGELRLHFQPQVEITSGKLIGLEALVRWHHPTRGLVPPSLFIPIAEKTGAIIPLGNWVFDEACRQFSEWRLAGIAPRTLAVNLSAIQCKYPNLEKDFREIIARHAIPPYVIELELTESVLMDTTLQQRDIIERLKSIGFKIAIDDFGTGYSSLDYLATYPVDRLKIAQELVFGVTADVRHALVVKAAVRLAHELGTEVIAEGVESEAQARFLIDAECKYAQGYFFSRPLTADATTALLRQGRVSHSTAGDLESEAVSRTGGGFRRLETHTTKRRDRHARGMISIRPNQ